MDGFYGGWPEYVSVAERRARADHELAKLRKKVPDASPVVVAPRGAIAKTFWGRAWCTNLESYRDYEYRLDRGRAYVRHGAVIDLKIAPREIFASVSGSSVYKVKISIAAVPGAQWRSIRADCGSSIESLVALLQGQLSQPVMERLCRQGQGLFPKPAELKFSCTCYDGASMCKHVAAAMYGVGARLDAHPALLFRMRAVDEAELVAGVDATMALKRRGAASGRVLVEDDVAALFGIDMEAMPAVAAKPVGKPKSLAKPAAKSLARGKAAPVAKAVAKTARPAKSAPARAAPASPAKAKTPVKIKPSGRGSAAR